MHRIAGAFALILISVLVAGPAGATASSPQRAPAVARSATPPGWTPVDFGDLQLSIPASWAVITGGEEACGSDAPGVLILGQGGWCTATSGETAAPGTSIVTVASSKPPLMPTQAPALEVNGIAVYAPGIAPVYFIPALQIELTFGGPLQPRILRSITYSPRAVALARTNAPVPKGWHRASFNGVSLAVPPSWRVNRTMHAPACGTDAVLPLPGLTLASQPALPVSCPAPPLTAESPVAGVEIDGFAVEGSPSFSCLFPKRINNLKVCIEARPLYGVLTVQVSGVAMATSTVKIGMFGNGLTGRIILDSLRRSKQGVSFAPGQGVLG